MGRHMTSVMLKCCQVTLTKNPLGICHAGLQIATSPQHIDTIGLGKGFFRLRRATAMRARYLDVCRGRVCGWINVDRNQWVISPQFEIYPIYK